MTDALKLAEEALERAARVGKVDPQPIVVTLAQAVIDNHAEIERLRGYVGYWKRQAIGIDKAASDFEECAETAEAKLSAMREMVVEAQTSLRVAMARFLTSDYKDRDHGWIVEDHLKATEAKLTEALDRLEKRDG